MTKDTIIVLKHNVFSIVTFRLVHLLVLEIVSTLLTSLQWGTQNHVHRLWVTVSDKTGILLGYSISYNNGTIKNIVEHVGNNR